MQRTLVLLLACASLLAGCADKDTPPMTPTPPTASEDGRTETDFDAEAPTANGAPGTSTGGSSGAGVETIPLLLDGSVGSAATVCVFGPVGQCQVAPVQEGDSGLLLDGLAGWIDGGEVTIAWEAASPATEQLAAGFMLMDGGEGCEGLELGGAHGASPLTIAIEPASRPLCAGEVVHLWISGNTYGGHDAVYYQADVDQEFHAEGSFLLREPSEGSA